MIEELTHLRVMSSASADTNQSTSTQENLITHTPVLIAVEPDHVVYQFSRTANTNTECLPLDKREVERTVRVWSANNKRISTNSDGPFIMDMRPHVDVETGIATMAERITLASEDNNNMVDLRENANDSSMGDDEPVTEPVMGESQSSRFWSSANQPNRGHVSELANRKSSYKPKGTTMSKARSNHVANSTSPASTNPSKFWIGTYYCTPAEQKNYTESGELPEVRMNMGGAGDIDVWRGQWEMGGQGDKAGKLHVQFAVIFNMKVRAPQAKRILSNVVVGDEICLFPFTGWLMPARSDSVWDYVTKEETRVAALPDFGECRDASGERSDLDFIYERIAAGAPIYYIMEQFPRQFMRNHAAISKLCSYYDTPRAYGDIHVEVWWGVTGSGKSHKAFHEFPDAYRKSIPGKWFEGYKGQDTVIFEEFNPLEDKELRLPELLKILDKYPYQVEIKGASCQLKATKFIFTTNIDPRKWYEGHPQQPALHRRINGVTVFKLNYQQQVESGKSGIFKFEGIKGIQEQLPEI